MLRHATCEPITLVQDAVLPASVAYVQREVETKLWWSLDFLYERFHASGEKRKLFKWIQFFKQGVKSIELCSDDFFCHTKTVGLPIAAVKENLATTSAVLAFLAFIQKESRTDSIRACAEKWIPGLLQRALFVQSGLFSLAPENMLPLHVTPGGSVRGLEETLSARHRSGFYAWQREWNAMHRGGLLAEPLTDGEQRPVTMQDLAMFLFTVDKRRRAERVQPWSRESVAGKCLYSIQKALVSFLASSLDLYVLGWYMTNHDVTVAPPARRDVDHASNEPGHAVGGQMVVSRKPRVNMSADAIFELLSDARDKTLSMRHSLGVLQNERLSTSGGCKANAVDAWVRRSQTIYDQRACHSMQGANHFSMVADGSCHAGKETLVSAVYSHENDTACMCNVQIIMPLDTINPSEAELSSLVEDLAKDAFTLSV